MIRVTIAAALFATGALAAGYAADEPKKDDKGAKAAKVDIKKLMAAAHRGEKSPHAALVAELKKEAPDWAAVGATAKAFGDMGAAFKEKPSYNSPDKYVSASEALAKAARAKDKKAATEAFAALRASCTSCHNGYASAIHFTDDGLVK
jgi:cytochrome c556